MVAQVVQNAIQISFTPFKVAYRFGTWCVWTGTLPTRLTVNLIRDLIRSVNFGNGATKDPVAERSVDSTSYQEPHSHRSRHRRQSDRRSNKKSIRKKSSSSTTQKERNSLKRGMREPLSDRRNRSPSPLPVVKPSTRTINGASRSPNNIQSILHGKENQSTNPVQRVTIDSNLQSSKVQSSQELSVARERKATQIIGATNEYSDDDEGLSQNGFIGTPHNTAHPWTSFSLQKEEHGSDTANMWNEGDSSDYDTLKNLTQRPQFSKTNTEYDEIISPGENERIVQTVIEASRTHTLLAKLYWVSFCLIGMIWYVIHTSRSIGGSRARSVMWDGWDVPPLLEMTFAGMLITLYVFRNDFPFNVAVLVMVAFGVGICCGINLASSRLQLANFNNPN